MRPEIDRDKLALRFGAWIDLQGYSYRQAASLHEGLNPAMINRARTGQVLSAASLLALCRAMGADPLEFLVFVDQTKQKQAVTAKVQRETEAHPYG